jgi:hypothetical protein
LLKPLPCRSFGQQPHAVVVGGEVLQVDLAAANIFYAAHAVADPLTSVGAALRVDVLALALAVAGDERA